jgi:hypothetical protein
MFSCVSVQALLCRELLWARNATAGSTDSVGAQLVALQALSQSGAQLQAAWILLLPTCLVFVICKLYGPVAEAQRLH